MMKLKLIAIVALLATSLGGCVYVPYDHDGYGYRHYYGYHDGHRYYHGDGYYGGYHDHGD